MTKVCCEGGEVGAGCNHDHCTGYKLVNKKSQDFVQMCSTGFGCGLKTLGESFNQMASHYDLFWKIEEANEKIAALAREIESYPKGYDTSVKEAMGSDWVEAERAAEEAYWKTQKALPEEPTVDEDDWELGAACGLDPEVCESCQ